MVAYTIYIFCQRGQINELLSYNMYSSLPVCLIVNSMEIVGRETVCSSGIGCKSAIQNFFTWHIQNTLILFIF